MKKKAIGIKYEASWSKQNTLLLDIIVQYV